MHDMLCRWCKCHDEHIDLFNEGEIGVWQGCNYKRIKYVVWRLPPDSPSAKVHKLEGNPSHDYETDVILPTPKEVGVQKSLGSKVPPLKSSCRVTMVLELSSLLAPISSSQKSFLVIVNLSTPSHLPRYMTWIRITY